MSYLFYQTLLLCIILSLNTVLSTLNEIEDASVTIGDPATFTCYAAKGDTDFSISWKVDDEVYTCDASDTSSENIHCFMMNDTVSVLRIENTTTLATMSHTVECILRHTIPTKFLEDCSLPPAPQCGDVIRSATLNFKEVEPTIVSSSESNTHTHIHIHSRSTCFERVYPRNLEKGRGKETVSMYCILGEIFLLLVPDLLCYTNEDTLAKGRVWPLFH